MHQHVAGIMSQQRYPLAVHSWKSPAEPIIIRLSPSREIIASFPLDFVRMSGVGTWRYIKAVLRHLIDIDESTEVEIRDAIGDDMLSNDEVVSGDYILAMKGELLIRSKSRFES